MAANWQLVDDQRSDGVWLSGGNLELAGRAPVKSFCGHVATAKRERGSYGLRREVRMAGSHRGTSVCVCVRDFQCQPKHSAAFADRVDSNPLTTTFIRAIPRIPHHAISPEPQQT